jgi:Zn-finger nucleic acid-binding protein
MATGNATLRCDYCNSVVIALPDNAGVCFLDETPNLTCPLCTVPLWSASLAGMQLQACKRCHGQLVSMAAFEELIERMRAQQDGAEIPAALDHPDLNRSINCPNCHHLMDTHFYYGGGNAVISGCEQCNLNWLDGGVLMRIVRAPHRDDTQADAW